MNGTIFMIHGMAGGGWHWDNYKAFFEEKGYRCMTPYLRYHQIDPGAPAPDGLGETSLLDYARDLEAEISRLPEKPILMGHSMGGLLAQILAARECAKAAVLITPAAPAWIFSIRWSALRSFSGVLFKRKFWKKAHKLSYRNAVYAFLNKLPEEEARTIYDRCVWESGRAVAEIGLWPLGFKGAGVKRKHVRCPVLVVAGTEDRATPAAVVRKIASRYRPFATYMEFAGHAHLILKEPGWEKVAGHISLWLADHLADS